MTRLLMMALACALVSACGTDGKSGESATRTERSATEPGVTLSGYARVGISKRF